MAPRDADSRRTSVCQAGALLAILGGLGSFINPLWVIGGIFGLILYIVGKRKVLVMICLQCGEKKEFK